MSRQKKYEEAYKKYKNNIKEGSKPTIERFLRKVITTIPVLSAFYDASKTPSLRKRIKYSYNEAEYNNAILKTKADIERLGSEISKMENKQGFAFLFPTKEQHKRPASLVEYATRAFLVITLTVAAIVFITATPAAALALFNTGLYFALGAAVAINWLIRGAEKHALDNKRILKSKLEQDIESFNGMQKDKLITQMENAKVSESTKTVEKHALDNKRILKSKLEQDIEPFNGMEKNRVTTIKNEAAVTLDEQVKGNPTKNVLDTLRKELSTELSKLLDTLRAELREEGSKPKATTGEVENPKDISSGTEKPSIVVEESKTSRDNSDLTTEQSSVASGFQNQDIVSYAVNERLKLFRDNTENEAEKEISKLLFEQHAIGMEQYAQERRNAPGDQPDKIIKNAFSNNCVKDEAKIVARTMGFIDAMYSHASRIQQETKQGSDYIVHIRGGNRNGPSRENVNAFQEELQRRDSESSFSSNSSSLSTI